MKVTDEMVEAALTAWKETNVIFGDLHALMRAALEAALSHAAGQDGEQCRAASLSTDNGFIGEAMGRLADEVEKPGSTVTITKADACAIGLYVRALSRGLPEGE